MGTTTEAPNGTTQGDAAAAEAAAKATADAAAAEAAAKATSDAAAAAAATKAAAEAAAKGAAPDYTGLALKDDSLLDKGAIERLSEAGKALGLPKEHAEKVLGFAEAEVVKVVEARSADWKTLVETTWPAAVKADAELGGEKFEVTKQNTERALARFATPEFKKALNDTGWGAHPELVRVFARIGAAMREDKFETPGSANTSNKADLATRIYGEQKAAS